MDNFVKIQSTFKGYGDTRLSEFGFFLVIFAFFPGYRILFKNEPVHWISNNVVCATSKGSDQPAHMRSLIRAFTSRLNIL